MSNNHNIILNYPEIRVDNPQLITDNLGNISIQSTFIGKPNEPNVIYSAHLLHSANALPQNFQAEKLHVYSRIHDLKSYKQDLNYDGELIIKNKSHTTQQVIYTIFLLKTQKATDIISNLTNSFNQLLDKSSSINELLKYPTKSTYLDITSHKSSHKFDKYLVYSDKSTNQIVIIDTNVIYVSEDLSKYSNTQTLFRVSQNYDVVEPHIFIEKSVEGFSIDEKGTVINDDPNGDYLICDNLPIGSTEELNYIIPATSPVVDALAQNDAMSTMVKYTLFFILFIFVFFSSSIFYNYVFTTDNEFFTSLVKFWTIPIIDSKISYIATWITLFTFILFIIFIGCGIGLNIPILTGLGITIVLSYAVGAMSIKNNKDLQLLIDDKLTP